MVKSSGIFLFILSDSEEYFLSMNVVSLKSGLLFYTSTVSSTLTFVFGEVIFLMKFWTSFLVTDCTFGPKIRRMALILFALSSK
jgi:hypothetical protein